MAEARLWKKNIGVWEREDVQGGATQVCLEEGLFRKHSAKSSIFKRSYLGIHTSLLAVLRRGSLAKLD